jgi:hypothetical protein
MANEGEEVDADYQEDVNYDLGANCEPDEPCEYLDVKVITCTINGCEVTETCTVNGCEVKAQQSDLTLLSDPVLESQDVIGTDQESIITQDTLPQSEECIGNNAVCSSPSSEVVTPVDGTVPATDTANSLNLISTSSSTTHPAVEPPLGAASVTVQEEWRQQVQQPEVLESPLDTVATTVTTDDIENNKAGAVDDATSELSAVATDNIGNEEDSATTAASDGNQEGARNTGDQSLDNNPDTSTDDSGTSGTSGLSPNNDNEENKADDISSDDSDAGDSGDSDEIDNNNDSGDDSGNDKQDGSKDTENESDTDDTSSDDSDAGDSGDSDEIDNSDDSGDDNSDNSGS